MPLYLATSDSQYHRRWQYLPRHLVTHDTEPHRGMRAASLCGVYVNVFPTQFDAQNPPHRKVCKTCLKVAARKDS